MEPRSEPNPEAPAKTILLVDDSAVNREVGAAHLEQRGFQVVTAADGAIALQLTSGRPFDLVLLDIVMPGMSGLEVLTALRREHPPEDLPIIMATAKDGSQDMVQAFDLGATDYVTKPIDWAVVQARILAHLRSRPSNGRTNESPAVGELGPGSLLADRYRLETFLGRGRHGTVYRARHLELGRPVAVKVLRAPAPDDPELAQRLEREGISACRVRHPNAVAVYDFAVTREGTPFLVMELLEGEPLDRELRRGPLGPRRCADILTPICAALSEAHTQGVVHRDIKPHNIFLHRPGGGGEVVKVVDFGIATFVDGFSADQRLTAAGNRPGTPAYMAPERFSDQPYDGRVDVYSLGITLYELLAGQLPYNVEDGNLLRIIRMHLAGESAPLSRYRSDLSPTIEQIVRQAMAKTPEDRPSPLELAERFAAAVVALGETGMP